jgi:hypothetical protein
MDDPTMNDPLWTPTTGHATSSLLGIYFDPEYAKLLPEAPRGLWHAATGDKLTWKPTGVHDYKRIHLSRLFPQLERVTLDVWYRMPRIPCCAFQALTPDNDLMDCLRCENRGYVCPQCRGDRRVKRYYISSQGYRTPYDIACPTCCLVAEPGDPGDFSEVLEQKAVAAWLMLHYPKGPDVGTL